MSKAKQKTTPSCLSKRRDTHTCMHKNRYTQKSPCACGLVCRCLELARVAWSSLLTNKWLLHLQRLTNLNPIKWKVFKTPRLENPTVPTHLANACVWSSVYKVFLPSSLLVYVPGLLPGPGTQGLPRSNTPTSLWFKSWTCWDRFVPHVMLPNGIAKTVPNIIFTVTNIVYIYIYRHSYS